MTAKGCGVALGLLVGSWIVPMVGAAAPVQSDGASVAASEEATSSRVPGLAISIEPTVPEGDRIRGWVEERGMQVLAEHQPSLESEDLIHVTVGGGPYDYRIRVALHRSWRLLEQPDVLVCECGSDEMLEQVGEAIAAGAKRLAEVARAERSTTVAVVEVQAAPLQAPAVVEADKSRRVGALGYAGIGVGVLGVGLLAAGVPLALRPDEHRGLAGEVVETRSTRPAGIALAASGGVAIAVGVSLLVADLVRQRKRGLAVVPALGPRQVGLAITWRAGGRVHR